MRVRRNKETMATRENKLHQRQRTQKTHSVNSLKRKGEFKLAFPGIGGGSNPKSV
jgi:hypothetical protein